ncbi:MAG: hypothetical protein ACXU82_07955 [Caulobacteraceae bacterium]
MLAAILVFGLFGAPQPLPCPPRALVQCADTRALTANPGFQAALHDFLGPSHERLLHGDRPLYDQVLELMAKPESGAAPKVGEDMRLYAGCRRMSCPEKAAVIVGQRGILAVGLIDYTHGDPALEVIVRREDNSAWGPQQALRAWAAGAVTHQAEHDHANTSLHETRVRALDTEAAGGPPAAARRGLRELFSLPRL